MTYPYHTPGTLGPESSNIESMMIWFTQTPTDLQLQMVSVIRLGFARKGNTEDVVQNRTNTTFYQISYPLVKPPCHVRSPMRVRCRLTLPFDSATAAAAATATTAATTAAVAAAADQPRRQTSKSR